MFAKAAARLRSCRRNSVNGIGHSFARHRAQSKTRDSSKLADFSFPSSRKTLASRVFDKQLAVVGTMQDIRNKICRLALGGIACYQK
jgi:hypothetical protein